MRDNFIETIDGLPPHIINELEKSVAKIMNASGMFYRLFGRKKSGSTSSEKIYIKKYDANKKLQDLFGIRIALYFKDDVSICKSIITEKFRVDNIAQDEEDNEHFKPTRLNIVCKIPEDIKRSIPSIIWEDYPIDDTFEIQIRTVFSEGWHEIEHDLRYKCKEDWKNELEMDRALNGIFATLETCDWSILTMFDNLAYKMYQKDNWTAMLRNKFRIRFVSKDIDQNILELFNKDKNFAKDFLKIDRKAVILIVCKDEFSAYCKSYDNLIYLINALFIKNSELLEMTPAPMLESCSNVDV